ncbi:MAG: outer membrane lipoprotein chaperone LolA [Gammaproteobacteria bacterium]|nr:outer membrane lipoprotein chaperone LolA [Gammaproteobacteria bacterium]
MLTRIICAASLLGCLALPGAVAQTDNGLQRLEAFTARLDSLRAQFVQSLFDAQGKAVQESRGTVVLQRPGRFRWEYRLPYEQLIVADGEKLWVYDTELQQVTVKELDNALGNAPIMLLSERRPLQEDFIIHNLQPRDGLQWVELEPRVKDTDFTRITLGMDEQGMKVMELRDSFGQATEVRFVNLEINVAPAAESFVFVPPAGVDIIGKP